MKCGAFGVCARASAVTEIQYLTRAVGRTLSEPQDQNALWMFARIVNVARERSLQGASL